jgi:iron complex outermembrane receptor protein
MCADGEGHVVETSLLARRQLARSIRLVLLAAAASAVPLAAFAEDPAPESEVADLDEVIVTGSRIRGSEPVGSTVTAITRDDIDLAAPLTTSSLIQKLPQVFNLGVSENSRGQSGGSGNITYGTAINLRGLGPFSTLTLLDGHRAVPQGTTGFAVDPSIVPTLALERVEVVADGASAIYGSDAIAGVVNLIPRRTFEGVEVSLRGANADQYDERQIGAIGGFGWTSGHMMLALESSEHSNLNGTDREFFRGDLTARGGRDFRVTQCNPGNIVVAGVSHAIPAGGVTPQRPHNWFRARRIAATTPSTRTCSPSRNASRDGDVRPGDRRARVGLRRCILDAPGFQEPGWQPGGGTDGSQCESYFVRPPGSTVTSETVSYSFGDQLPSNDTEGFSESCKEPWARASGWPVNGDSRPCTAAVMMRSAALPSTASTTPRSTRRWRAPIPRLH